MDIGVLFWATCLTIGVAYLIWISTKRGKKWLADL